MPLHRDSSPFCTVAHLSVADMYAALGMSYSEVVIMLSGDSDESGGWLSFEERGALRAQPLAAGAGVVFAGDIPHCVQQHVRNKDRYTINMFIH